MPSPKRRTPPRYRICVLRRSANSNPGSDRVASTSSPRCRRRRSRRMVSGLATGSTAPPRSVPTHPPHPSPLDGPHRRRGRTGAASRRTSVQESRGRSPPGAVSNRGVNPYGRPESRTTMRCWLRETTSVIVAVQEPPRLVGDADRGSTRVLREGGGIGSVEHGAPAVVELAGSPAGEGLSLRRLEVGREFAVECRRDDVASPGADVDVPSSRNRARPSRSSGSMRIWNTSVRRMT